MDVLAVKWLVRHASMSLKQQRRPLPSLLCNSFFYGKNPCLVQLTWRHNRSLLLEGELEQREGGTVSLLRLVGVVEEGGRYDCLASTRLDSVSSRPAFIKINGRRGRRTVFTVKFFIFYFEYFSDGNE